MDTSFWYFASEYMFLRLDTLKEIDLDFAQNYNTFKFELTLS